MNVHYRKVDADSVTDVYVTKPAPYTYEFRFVVDGDEPGEALRLGCADAVPKLHELARTGFAYVEG